jgi:SAM-dependent methyltransferase
MKVDRLYNQRRIFHRLGKDLLNLLVRYGGLKPDDKVLDIGCGPGRIAIPLTQFLSARGSYDGFDIVEKFIQHCQRVITPSYPRFHFQRADIFNTSYNPKGGECEHSFVFPYPDNSFDFVFLTSVFTHLLSDGVENYLSEIHRVLKPGGRCFATYFLLNAESEKCKTFVYLISHGKAAKENNLESATAFDESYILKLYSKTGLHIIKPILYGSWSGRKDFTSYQDIIIGVKK